MWRDVDERSLEQERSPSGRSRDDERDRDESWSPDPRDVFARSLDLPRGTSREQVHANDKDYSLSGSEARMLATIGAFRVVQAEDLVDRLDRGADPREGELRHLKDYALVQSSPCVVGRTRTNVITLTDEGRSLLEAHRAGDRADREQAFYAGARKPRERTHDAQVYRAYQRYAERLVSRGARIRRVVLDYELKREYQQFLQEPNRGRSHADGRPQRSAAEIEQWAGQHQLPHIDGRVRFPDVRIEYEGRDGRPQVEDVEVLTRHYRGAHLEQRNRFSCYRAEPDPGLAGQFL